ncbi:Uncharacterised protein [Mycobacteroides abscessus subsp. abscessus]|nr:Uncharacterised protein [Mycobacteroides abscessus subsp. abscessus]
MASSTDVPTPAFGSWRYSSEKTGSAHAFASRATIERCVPRPPTTNAPPWR